MESAIVPSSPVAHIICANEMVLFVFPGKA
jgi:hypothetical protein